MTTPANPPLRFFISYRRRAAADARLAEALHIALVQAGCEVFIDQSMPMGIDWSAEIDRRLAWCDYLVVLLSKDSIASEMVQGEVRRAHHAARANGQSKILPVRVDYLLSSQWRMTAAMATANSEHRKSSSRAARKSGPVLKTMFLFTPCLIPTLDKFPRSQPV